MTNPSPVEVGALHNAAWTVLQQIQDTVESCGQFKSRLSIRFHVRSPREIANKLSRMQEADASASLHAIKDIVTLRFVTLFREDIGDVVRTIFQLLKGE